MTGLVKWLPIALGGVLVLAVGIYVRCLGYEPCSPGELCLVKLAGTGLYAIPVSDVLIVVGFVVALFGVAKAGCSGKTKSERPP